MRLRSDGAKSSCRFAEIEVEGIVFLSTDIVDSTSYMCDATVQNRDSQVITFTDAVEFRDDKTAKITSISQDLGTTIGGT